MSLEKKSTNPDSNFSDALAMFSSTNTHILIERVALVQPSKDAKTHSEDGR